MVGLRLTHSNSIDLIRFNMDTCFVSIGIVLDRVDDYMSVRGLYHPTRLHGFVVVVHAGNVSTS